MTDEDIPLYGSRGDAKRWFGFGYPLIDDLIRVEIFRTVDIEGRKYIALREGAERLAAAVASGERITLATPQREAELARKAKLREAKRTEQRAEQRRKRGRPRASAKEESTNPAV
jgi:hypothetical protein